MAAAYSYVLAEAVSEHAFGLPADEQAQLAAIFRSLANAPDRTGDYPTTDDSGRHLQNLLVDDWVVTFWCDHAVKEIRIVEIAKA